MEKNRHYQVLKELGVDVDICRYSTNGPLYEDVYEGRYDGYRDIWRSNYEDSLDDYDRAS